MTDPRLTEDTSAWVHPFCSPRLPPDWERTDVGTDGARWLHAHRRFSVILSGATEADGKRWLHLSCAHATHLPSWDDLTWVKRTWLGDDRHALIVLPRADVYVNLHPFCLHLWHCLDGYPLPEFSGIVAGLRTI